MRGDAATGWATHHGTPSARRSRQPSRDVLLVRPNHALLPQPCRRHRRRAPTLRRGTDKTGVRTGTARRGARNTPGRGSRSRCVTGRLRDRPGLACPRAHSRRDDERRHRLDGRAHRPDAGGVGRARGRGSGVDPLDQNAVRRWLREVHGVKQNSQWAIADAAARDAGWVRPTVEEYVDAQFTGRRRRCARSSTPSARPPWPSGTTSSSRGGHRTCRSCGAGSSPRSRRRRRPGSTSGSGCPTRRPPPGYKPATAPGPGDPPGAAAPVADVDDEVRGLLRAAYEQNG